MRSFTDSEVIERVESLPTFKGWKAGIYDIWIRSTADQFDAFDDKAFTFKVEAEGQKPKFVMSRNGTTNAGSYGLKNFQDYNHLGCAVLKADVLIYDSHVYGLHKKKAAYRQSKAWPYFRDNNRNNRAEEIGKQYLEVIGANIHRAGVDSTVIKNWSTACLVTANLQKFTDFLAYMKKQGNPPLNVAILKEWPKGAKLSAVASNGDSIAKTDQGGPINESAILSINEPTEAPPSSTETVTKQEVDTPTGSASIESTKKSFNPDTITQYIPKMKGARNWFATLSLGGIASTTWAAFNGLPPWAIFVLGMVTMAVLIGFAFVVIRYRTNLFDLVKHVISINADPNTNTIELVAEK